MASPLATPEPGKGPGYYEDLINRVDTRIEEGGAAAEAPHPTTPVGPLPFVCHNHSLLALFFAADGEVPPVMASCACCIDVGPLRRRQRFYVFFFVMALTFFTYGEVLACPAPFPAHPWTNRFPALARAQGKKSLEPCGDGVIVGAFIVHSPRAAPRYPFQYRSISYSLYHLSLHTTPTPAPTSAPT